MTAASRRALLLAPAAPATQSETRFIAVTGGRGGVGKSVVAAQMAWALAREGRRVLLADLDLVSPSLHTIMGLPPPRAGLGVLLTSDRPIGDALVATAHPNLWLLAGGRGGLPAQLGPSARRLLHERLRHAGAEVVVMDVGAGAHPEALSLLSLGHHRLIVASGQAASVHDGFALLKAGVLRLVESYLRRAGYLPGLSSVLHMQEGQRMGDLLRRVAATDLALARDIEQALGSFGAALVGNQLPDFAHVGALQAMARMADEYLGVTVPLVGWLRGGLRLPDLTAGGRFNASSEEAQAFHQLAVAVMQTRAFPTAEIFFQLAQQASPPPAAAARSTPPPLPVAAQQPPPAVSAAPVAAITDTPSGALRVKPLVYVRPPRRRRPQPARTATPAAGQAETPGRSRTRTLTLPGMPPRRDA